MINDGFMDGFWLGALAATALIAAAVSLAAPPRWSAELIQKCAELPEWCAQEHDDLFAVVQPHERTAPNE